MMESIWEGVLEKGKNPSSSSGKDWRPMLFVLKRPADVPMLAYYRDTRKRWQKQSSKAVVVLSPWFHVSIIHECAYKFSFMITHPEGTIYLAAKDNETMNTWIVNIQAQMTLNIKEGDDCYEVEAIPSDDMYKLQARGNLIIKLSCDKIELAQAGGRLSMIANWPLNSLKRYSSENGIFTIEMGRRSPRGQGIYLFRTARCSELFDKVHSLIRRVAAAPQNTLHYKNSGDIPGASSFGFDIDRRPPAPLPPRPPEGSVLDDVDSGGVKLKYDSVNLQHRQHTLLGKSYTAQSRDEEPSTYDITRHDSVKSTNSDPVDHLYDVLNHSKGPLAAPPKPNLKKYDIVYIEENDNTAVIPQGNSPYDLAFPSKTDSNSDQQPVSNPVYSLGGLSNNPMYGTSADVEEVKQSLENSEQMHTFMAANGQGTNEIESSDEHPPPIPPQYF